MLIDSIILVHVIFLQVKAPFGNVKNETIVHLSSGSSKVALDQEGNNSVIFRVLEKVHECPTCHLGVGKGSSFLPLYVSG